MKELVRPRMRPSRDRKSFRYMLDYLDQTGKRRQISVGHADKRQAERQRREKELELRANIAGPVSMKLTHFFGDSLARTKGQVRATTLKEMARSMNDFVACVGDIDVAKVQYRHGEQFIQYCLGRDISAATVAKKVKHLKRVFQLAEDRGQLDQHPLRKLKPPKAARRKIRVFTADECDRLCAAARQYEQEGRTVKWELLIRMCLATGMRRGELMNTTWRDVDFANMTVEVSGGSYPRIVGPRPCAGPWPRRGQTDTSYLSTAPAPADRRARPRRPRRSPWLPATIPARACAPGDPRPRPQSA